MVLKTYRAVDSFEEEISSSRPWNMRRTTPAVSDSGMDRGLKPKAVK
jgi:hypothetical protein